jgi:hypothetical protein
MQLNNQRQVGLIIGAAKLVSIGRSLLIAATSKPDLVKR